MSIEAMNAVWDHSQSKGNTRLVLLAIANAANPQGWNSYQFQESIAKRAGGISLRTVERCVAEAVEMGELEVDRPDRSKQNHYSVLLPGLAIFDDPAERDRRDEHYENLSLGRAEKTRQRRANRRSEDPTAVTGPSTSDPTAVSGGTRQQCRVGPDSPDGWDPTAVSGLKEETPLNTNETTRKTREGIADQIVDLIEREYPQPIGGNTIAVRIAAEQRAWAGETADRIAAILAAWKSDERWLEKRGRFIPSPQKFLTEARYQRGPDGEPVSELLTSSIPADVDEISGEDWDWIREAFESTAGSEATNTWLTQTKPIGINREQLILEAPMRVAEWIQLRYTRPLINASTQVLGKTITEIRFVEPPANQGVAA